jgi:diguanylate cyclase (GGDEF)-like protein
MRHLLTITLSIALYLLAGTYAKADTAAPISVDINYDAIGEHVTYLQEKDQALTIEQARDAFSSGEFLKWNKPVLSFGIGTSPLWVRFTIDNSYPHKLHRRLIIENSWLDLAEIFIVRDGQVTVQKNNGDSMVFDERAPRHRFLVFDHDYAPGQSVVYIRASTPDPMVLPIFFGDMEASAARDVFNGYSYGIFYGILIALLIYNLSIYLSIRQARYFYYVLYLSMFLLMNISYTGHGYENIWSGSVWAQQWINPISITLAAMTGVIFAFSFLNIRKLFPRLFLYTGIFCLSLCTLQLVFIVLDMQTASVAASIAFVMLFSIFTFYCAIISFHRGHRDAIYYLVATIATLVGTAVTALTVWAIIPYSLLTYRAAEIAISIDALLLSMALAEQIRRAHREKMLAQQLARTDMLTRLYNRRAFNEVCSPIWHNAIRHKQKLCIILLDIDEFKLINDHHGHAAGDQVLKQVAAVLQDTVREGDVLARWGGEEFAIMLPLTMLEDAVIMAERIRETVSAMRVLYGISKIRTTISSGVAQIDDSTRSIEDLFKVADAVLYQAKLTGRNKVCSA